MNDIERKFYVEAFEAIAHDIERVKSDLVVLHDFVFAGDMEGDPPKVTLYSQRDLQWANIKMGYTSNTIGNFGCLMTVMASILTDAGKEYNPATLNAWLTMNNGYTGGNFIFPAVDKLNAVKYEYIVDCATKPAPIEQLDQEIKVGKYIAVKVDFNPATMLVEQHWVRYLGNGKMFDPWVGDVAPIIPRYRGANPAQAILRAAVYRKVTV